METLYTKDPKKGYTIKVGNVIGHNFFKKVKRAKHYFKLVHGYAIQEDVFKELIRLKVKDIFILEEDTGDEFKSTIDQWKEHMGKGNWGHGRQYVLSEKYMDKPPFAIKIK